jgi:hypothetical protein
MTLHLEMLKVMPHFSVHSIRLSKALCNFSLSSVLATVCPIFVSSANFFSTSICFAAEIKDGNEKRGWGNLTENEKPKLKGKRNAKSEKVPYNGLIPTTGTNSDHYGFLFSNGYFSYSF